MIAPTPPHGSPPPSDSNGSTEPQPERPDPDKLGDEIAELAAHIDAARYRLLVLIRQVAELERWGPGFKSCNHWLSWRIGITLPTAREHVRVALALGKLPLLSAAMERGEISYSRARAITRVATSENEERLVEFALSATAMQLEHLVRAWRKVERLEDEQVRHERRYLTLYADDDGSYVLRGRLDSEVGELLGRALDGARSALYREKEERTRLETSPGQRAADALGLVAEWALGSSVLPEEVWPDAVEEANDASGGDEQAGAGAAGAGSDGDEVDGDDGITGNSRAGPDEAAEGNGQAGAGTEGGEGGEDEEARDVGTAGSGSVEAGGAAEQSGSERQDAIPPEDAGEAHVSAEEEEVAWDVGELVDGQRTDREVDVSAETNGAAPGRGGRAPLPASPDASAETGDAAPGRCRGRTPLQASSDPSTGTGNAVQESEQPASGERSEPSADATDATDGAALRRSGDGMPPPASLDASNETKDPDGVLEDLASGRRSDHRDDVSAETERAESQQLVNDHRSDRKADTSAEGNGESGSRKAGRAKRPKRPARPKTAHRSDRFLVVLHLDQEGVRVPGAGRSTSPRLSHAVLDGKGVGIPDETCRRLACDSSVVVMTHAPDGSVLDVGRKRRTIPPAIRRAVNYRDGGCRFPGCGLKIVDDHHLHHWIDGGETKVSNVAELCRVHHRLVHEGGFRMELLKNGEARFYSPDGRLVPNTAPRPGVEGDAEERVRRENDRAGLDIGPCTATPDWHGERFDLHYGLWTLRGQYADDPYADDQRRDDPDADDQRRDDRDEADPDKDDRPGASP